jgi:choline kinase
MKVIILAAGIGSRLGQDIPKALVHIDGSTTILDSQICSLKKYVKLSEVIIVTGYRKEFITQRYKDLNYSINHDYAKTNTSKSLLKGLEMIDIKEDIIYMNGDVIFDPEIIRLVLNNRDINQICVNNEKVGEEEVKYGLDEIGNIKCLSKKVKEPLGEAVGINYVNHEYLAEFIDCLKLCDDMDYHERAVEFAIEKGITFCPLNIGNRFCIEIDYKEDLEKAIQIWKQINND